MNAGRLRHRVTLRNRVETQDATTGALSVTWTDVATVWAAVEPLSAREFIAAQAVSSQVTTRITIRFRDDVTPKMRAVHGSTVYDITGVLADPKSGREYLTLPVAEVVGA